jgi:hypothetical protein
LIIKAAGKTEGLEARVRVLYYVPKPVVVNPLPNLARTNVDDKSRVTERVRYDPV